MARIAKLLVGVVALLTVAGGALFFLQLGPFAAAAGEPEPEPTPEVVDGEIVDVGTLTVNVIGAKKGTSDYARVGLAVVLPSDAEATAVADVTAKLPLLRDASITTVAAFQADTLRTPEGHELLRQALSDVADELYGAGTVRRVVLTELIVQ